MTLTIAIIVNAALMAGIVAALFRVIRIPFRIDRRARLKHAVYLPAGADELDRAA